MPVNSYERLADPPVDRLDEVSCEYLAYEDGRIAAAANARASELFATYNSQALLAISELQEFAALVRTSAEAYRAAAKHAPPRRP
ncbi:hypothetical protein AB0F91_39835 [Amycolatopsis sp. NPDC023774]|uniref:hypothetical protein n=1 Tax=Amycolatopsis sp. NPDC023774 TaxID=3155015 RepID=UPI0033D6146A